MAVKTYSFRYRPTTAPSGTEDRVLACSHTTDACHCVINSSGQIGYYVSGSFTQLGTKTQSIDSIWHSYIVEKDDLGNGCIYVDGQKIGCATNFPIDNVNQIGNFKTELKPEVGRKPKVGLKPRGVSNIYTRPCCGDIDEIAYFDRQLSASEIVDLAQSGSLSKVYTLADYKITAMADDNIIATTEKPRYSENWRSIWDADQRTSALPTAIGSITVNGSYKSLANAANSAGIWTPSTSGTAACDYYQAVESWRQMYFVSSGGGTGFLLTSQLGVDTDISSMSPTLEARQSALMFAEDALRSAIMIKRQSTAELTAVANANAYTDNAVIAYTPKYLGRYYQSHPDLPNNGDWWLVYGLASSPVTRGFWYNNNGTKTLVSTLGTEAQRKYKGSGLEDVLYASNNGYALTSGGVYDPVGIYGVSTMEFLAVNQAFIQKLMVQELTLKSTGKIKSENFVPGESGFQLQASDGSAEFNNVKVRGTVYSGERYNQDGSDKNTNADGYWLGADGTMKAENGYFSGVLGQEKKITIKDYFISMFTSNSFTSLTKKLISWGAGLFWYKYNTTTASWDSIASLEANPLSSSSAMKATGKWLFDSAINGRISADPYKINGSYTYLGLYNMLRLYGASINVGETILATGFMRIGSGRVVVSFLTRKAETAYTIYGYDTYSDDLFNSGNGFSVSSTSSDIASGVFVLAW